MIRLTNKLPQGLNILLNDGSGRMRSWTIPSRGVRIIRDIEMSQDVLDKSSRGHLAVEELGDD